MTYKSHFDTVTEGNAWSRVFAEEEIKALDIWRWLLKTRLRLKSVALPEKEK